MFYDSAMLARARAEVQRSLLGARLREPLQLRHDEVVLAFRREPPANCLLLSSSPQFGRVHLGAPPEERPQPQPFGLALRKHLRGARLQAASQPGFDRVLRLDFDECEGFGPEVRRSLVVEVMGKHGNMALLDEEERIISCAKHVPARLNRYREIMEGEPYVPPPTFGKLDPRHVTVEALRARLAAEPDADLDGFLQRSFLGTSKVFCAEVIARFPAPGRTVGELSEGELHELLAVLQSITTEADAEGPVYIYEGPESLDLPARFAYPVRLRCCGEPVGEAARLGEALVPLMTQEAEARVERELRQRLSGAARAQLRELDRRLADLRKQVGRAERAEAQRKTAELLLSQPHAAKPYAKEVELLDYYTEGTPVFTVALDPPGDLQGTARRLFGRARRASRILQRVPPLIEQAERESEYLESVLEEIDLAEGLSGLGEIEEELARQGYLRKRQQVPRGPGARDARPQLRRRTSSDEYAILYGTNHAQNDELVRTAAPDDLWLHVQGAPGAHVLIRTSGHPERVPRRTLIEAAQIAARFSRLRNQEAVDVDYTRAKHVRKQKGERPGMVYYTHQKTITVRVT